MNRNPYSIVCDFENELCEYTGAPYAVAVNSCTIALEMVCAYLRVGEVTIPKRTYASVPQAIVKAGGFVKFDDRVWRGAYRLEPYPIWDCAPRFTSGMYNGGYQCLSFHRRKILGHTEGGAILMNDLAAAQTLRIMRHDGRDAGSTMPSMIGYHAVMNPGTAAELLARMGHIAKHNGDMRRDNYPDLSTVDWNALYWISGRGRDKNMQPALDTSELEALRDIRNMRAANNNNWMDLLEHVASNEPQYFREWQAKTRKIDMQVSKAMEVVLQSENPDPDEGLS